MSVRERLIQARRHAGYRSARQAALTMGWPYPTYASHENGIREIPYKVAQKYARAFRVSPEFILFGTNGPDWVTEPRAGPSGPPTLSLPLFSSEDAAGLRAWLADERLPLDGAVYVITDPGGLSGGSFALRVESEEMRAKPPILGEREVVAGDIVIIDRQRPPRPGDIVALLVEGSPLIHLRKVVASAANRIAYIALNRDYGELDDARVVGRAGLHIQRL